MKADKLFYLYNALPPVKIELAECLKIKKYPRFFN
jgi:hypothetical protein